MSSPKLDPSAVTFGKLSSIGTKFINRQIISFDDIYIPPMKGDKTNSARRKGKSPFHIQNLASSLKQGIDYSKMPPVVQRSAKQVNGKIYQWELVTGNHRLEALRFNDCKEWIFDVYDFSSSDMFSTKDAISTFQLRENNFAPELPSTGDDVINVIRNLIQEGSLMISPDEESIKDYVDNVCTNMHGNTRNKVVAQVIRVLKNSGQKVHQEFVTYTAQDVTDFIKGEKLDIVVGGNFDHKRKEFGWSVLEGYPHEFVLNAAKKFVETGNKSYFTFHTYRPLDNQTVKDKRDKMLSHLSSVEESLVKAVEYYQKNGVFPWRVNGYLPQDVSNGEKSYINT
jgi:hypothetical protein